MSEKCKKELNIWVFGDAHVGTDLPRGRESLADALRTSERGGDAGGPPFEWYFAIDVGDMSGGQSVPKDEEGEEVVRQFGQLRDHRRESVYSVCGNHDRSGLNEPPAWWWQKWVDPMGENTACSGVDPERSSFPVEGTWESYSLRSIPVRSASGWEGTPTRIPMTPLAGRATSKPGGAPISSMRPV